MVGVVVLGVVVMPPVPLDMVSPPVAVVPPVPPVPSPRSSADRDPQAETKRRAPVHNA